MRFIGGFLRTAGLVVALFATDAHAAGEFKANGVMLPNGSVRIGDNRYRLPENWEATVKWMKTNFKPEKYPRKLVLNQPGIKAVHFQNPEPKDEWEGFNLYEFQGEVRLFVLLRDKK